jgi:hypothetical protein
MRSNRVTVLEVSVRNLASFSVASVFIALVAVACDKPATQPTPATAAGQAPVAGQPTQYPAQGAPQQGYVQQQPTAAPPGTYPQQGYAQPAPAPVGAAPVAAAPGAAPTGAAPMATPGPLALPCQNDQACGLAHCNTQYGKCAFPCQSAADCIQGASCNAMTGFCLPGGG